MVRISIVIPTYNEEKYIGATLQSIARQPYHDIEVLLADSKSSDKTVVIAKKIYPSIKVVVDEKGGVSPACNKAVKAAKAGIILFIDADTSITKNLLKAYEEAFDDDGVVAATGPIEPLENTTSSISAGFKIISVYLVKFFISIGKPSTISSNLAVSKQAFQKIGGFNESMKTYYDWDLSNRIRKLGKVVFVPQAIAKTSVRRVKKWGMAKYFLYHAGNAVKYHLSHKSRDDYEPIR
jgi:GT2 family glycosyltransferase